MISTRNVPRPGLDDLAIFGERGHAFLGIAPVVDEDAEQLPVGAPLADVEGQAALDVMKRPGWTMLTTKSAFTLVAQSRSSRRPVGAR